MDVKAILLVGGLEQDSTGERIGGTPIGLVDVLGEAVVQRVAERISRLGVTSTTIVTEYEDAFVRGIRDRMRPDLKWRHGSGEEFWKAAEQQFNEYAQGGAELVLVARVGAYIDLDCEEFVQFHIDRGARVSVATTSDGQRLDYFLVSASRRNDAAHLLRSHLKECRTECYEFNVEGAYYNLLRNASDLRELVLASFAGECSIRPLGREIRPGVWAAESARIHPQARVLAPAFIGRHTKLRASSVVTRGSSIEHHSVVDCGTVVEASSVLPYSYVGAGLDVTRSVVAFRHIANLTRNAEVEICDERLVSMVGTTAQRRTLRGAIDLIAYLPRTLMQGFFHRRAEACAVDDVAEAVTSSSPAVSALPETDAQSGVPTFPPNLFTARRYGNE